jgi:acetoacetyl-CoA synthetase
MRPIERTPRLLHYQRWLQAQRGLVFADYDALWRWSVDDLPGFWQSIWDHFAVESPTPHARVLDRQVMPGARWFEGAQVNFAHQVFRHADAAHAAGHPAIVFADEAMLARGGLQETSWPALRAQVAAFARALQALGVQPGDRVVAVLPNTPQTVAVFLAVASLGAIWSICSPDMGPVAVLDRFRQIEPKVLVACDGYTWSGRHHDRRAHVDGLLAELPSVQHAIRGERIDALLAGAGDPTPGAPLEARWLPFDHPLWIVYSSGTTGLPKPIVHGQGGILIEFLKGTLHNDLGPTIETGDRFHWFSSTGWIMWNAQLAGLLAGTTICIFDGNPGGPAGAPDWSTLWRFAGLARCTFFGAGAAFFASCLKADVHPMQAADLSALRAIGSTGSPLSEECHDWIWQRCPQVDGAPIWIDAISGGTDFAGAFVGGNRLLPQRRGVMQCRWLGAAVEAWSEDGRPLVDEVGELVCTQPMPSMPLAFWNDPGGARYRESYFEMFPGVWRHGDWIRITPEGGAVIYGRSDATINRHGVRMGTAELYRAVEALPEVVDSLVVDFEMLGRESWMPLFVVLREGLVLDAALDARIRRAVREGLSPRHVPSDIHQVAAVPRTLSGKKMELPVKKLLLGAAPEKVLNRDAMANADCVDWYVAFAARRSAGPDVASVLTSVSASASVPR